MATHKVAPTPFPNQSGTDDPTPERIYVASPKSIYGSGRLRRAVLALRTRFPNAFLLLPAEMFQSQEEWRLRFPGVLATLTRLVFVTDEEGFIGRGVAGECRAVLQAGKPVDLITDAGNLIPNVRLQLSPPNEEDWVKYRQVTIRPEGR